MRLSLAAFYPRMNSDRCMQGDIKKRDKMFARQTESSYPSFLYHHRQTSKKWRGKPWERVSMCYCCWQTSQLMNLTPLVKKDKIFVFFMCYRIFLLFSYDAWLFQLFLRGKGCKHIKHDLLWIQPRIQSTANFQADVRLHDILYLFALLFNFFKRSICDVCADE